MKKTIGIIIAVAVVAGMVLLLASNKKKMVEQTSSASSKDNVEKVVTIPVQEEAYDLSFTSNAVTQAVSELNFVSDVSGRVEEIYVDKGSRVRKGTPLLKIDPELYEADYNASKAAYEALKKDEQRFSRSNEAGGVTDQQLDNIRTQLVAAESRYIASKWKYENTTIKSPMDGTVNTRFIERGSLIAPNAPLFEIVNDSRLKLICNVSESRLGLLEKGQEVTATDSSLPGVEFTGKITHVGLKTDRGLNYPVEITLNSAPELRIGMYMKVQFSDASGHKGILVPRKAIVGSAKSAVVYVVSDSRAWRREVRLGEMIGDKVEILDGLEAGEQIVTAGLMNIGDGTFVKAEQTL